jgi:hypothetical protein
MDFSHLKDILVIKNQANRKCKFLIKRCKHGVNRIGQTKCTYLIKRKVKTKFVVFTKTQTIYGVNKSCLLNIILYKIIRIMTK